MVTERETSFPDDAVPLAFAVSKDIVPKNAVFFNCPQPFLVFLMILFLCSSPRSHPLILRLLSVIETLLIKREKEIAISEGGMEFRYACLYIHASLGSLVMAICIHSFIFCTYPSQAS